MCFFPFYVPVVVLLLLCRRARSTWRLLPTSATWLCSSSLTGCPSTSWRRVPTHSCLGRARIFRGEEFVMSRQCVSLYRATTRDRPECLLPDSLYPLALRKMCLSPIRYTVQIPFMALHSRHGDETLEIGLGSLLSRAAVCVC